MIPVSVYQSRESLPDAPYEQALIRLHLDGPACVRRYRVQQNDVSSRIVL